MNLVMIEVDLFMKTIMMYIGLHQGGDHDKILCMQGVQLQGMHNKFYQYQNYPMIKETKNTMKLFNDSNYP